MTRAIQPTDDGLLRRMLLGDEEAFTLLYRRKQPAIYRFSLHMSRNPAIAEDVTQEVFMALMRNLERFDSARGTLDGFLFGIARNHLRKRWEKESQMVPLTDPEGQRDSNGGFGSNGRGYTNELASLESVEHVRRAIAALPEIFRAVVVLCELEGMSYEETAQALACPVGTVRSRLHRARAMLLEMLREMNPMRRTTIAGK